MHLWDGWNEYSFLRAIFKGLDATRFSRPIILPKLAVNRSTVLESTSVAYGDTVVLVVGAVNI